MNFKIRLSVFLRSFFLQAGWNFMKYQNLGLTFVMLPFLKKLYNNDKEELSAVVKRYLETFNTQPIMASFCFGALAKKEEEIKNTKTITDFKEKATEWEAVKTSLSITTASIGDRLFWGTIKPLTLLIALFIWLWCGVNFLEGDFTQHPTLFWTFFAGGVAFVVFNAIALFVKWKGLKSSYDAGEEGCFGLIHFDWNKTIYNAKRLGLLLAVGMILFGVYQYFKGIGHPSLQFITRAIIVVSFVAISFVTRKLKIPNMYLYIISVIVFNIVCYL